MIRKLDKLWFRLLRTVYGWVLDLGFAHGEREKRRRRRRLMAWESKQRN